MIVPRSLLTVGALASYAEAVSFDVKSWQSTSSGFSFPEENLPEVQSSASVGITFSGGGDRAFLSSIGYLAGMHELGLLDDVKYIVGVSGGAWATAVYSYFQHDDISDATMLGKVVMPEDIVQEDLQVMDPNCVRSYTNSDYKTKDLGPSYEDYKRGVDYIYLDPSGVKKGTPFSYNADTVADIKSRNPELQNQDFNTVRGRSSTISGIDKRPYPIISTTLMSPYSLLPTMPANREWDLLEFTPMGTGIAYSEEVTYTDIDGDKTVTVPKGGYVEPFAFGMDAPREGLAADVSHGRLHIAETSSTHGDLLEGAASSSWAVGASLATLGSDSMKDLNGYVPYWSPSTSNPQDHAQTFGFADGAGVSNTNIISLLQRKVHRIVAVVSTSTPLQSSENWDPAVGDLSKKDIDFTVPAWFGHIATDLNDIDVASFDLENSHVFPESDFVPFVKGLQEAQMRGKGNIYVHRHRTVANPKFGIEAGQEVEMVWIYHGRCFEWESRLSDDMYDKVTPRFNKDDPAKLPSGDFEDFPHYSTGVNGRNFEQANLLSDLTGWIIHENYEMMDNFMHNREMEFEDESDSNDDDDSDNSVVLGVVLGVCSSLFVVVGILVYKRRQSQDDEYESAGRYMSESESGVEGSL